MQGSPTIIEALNEILTAELTTINQYFIHAKMDADSWGYDTLGREDSTTSRSTAEMKDTDAIIGRILYLRRCAQHAAGLLSSGVPGGVPAPT